MISEALGSIDPRFRKALCCSRSLRQSRISRQGGGFRADSYGNHMTVIEKMASEQNFGISQNRKIKLALDYYQYQANL